MDKSLPFINTYRSIRLTNSKGTVYNITSMVAELSIFEDIFSNTLTGELVIADGNGASDIMNVTGNDKLTVEMFHGEDIQIHEFYVYATTNRIRNNNTSEVYKLQFCSLESILNENTRLYSAFTGTNAESVRSIFRNYISSSKPLGVEETHGQFKFVMPSWTPFEAINFYAGRSVSEESKGSFFLFYETMKGFNFRCMDTLLQEEPDYTYHYSPVSGNHAEKDITNIREYEVVSMGDTVKGVKEDYTTLWTHDLVRKKIVKRRYEPEGLEQANGFGIDMKARRDVFGSETVFKPETRNVHTQTKDYTYDAIQNKVSSIRRFGNQKIRFLAFGNRDLLVGKTLDMKFLQTRVITETNKEDAEDKTLSGKYLITAVRHIFKAQDYHVSVEVVKKV